MVNDWLAEGFQQLRLGIACEAYAIGLSSAFPELAGRFRRLVLAPLLRVEWIPGVREVVGQLGGRGTTNLPAFFSCADRIRETFLGSWLNEFDGHALDGEVVANPRQRIQMLLLSSFELVLRTGLTQDLPKVPVRDWPARPVIEHLGPAEMAQAWLCEAGAVNAWPALAAEVADLRTQTECRHRWTELQTLCSRAGQQVKEAQTLGKSRLRRLLSAGMLVYALDDAGAALAQCQEAFAELAGPGHATAAHQAPVSQPPDVFGQGIQDLLQRTSNNWVPRQLIDLCHRLALVDPDRHQNLLSRTAPSAATASLWCEWERWLQKNLPETTSRDRAHLILLRAVIETVGDRAAANGVVWTQLEEAVGLLLTGDGLEVQLIHDRNRQQADWFTTLPDPSLESSLPGRAGLAVRANQGGWLCFPRGEQRVPMLVNQPSAELLAPPSEPQTPPPPRTPEERALFELDALVAEAVTASLAGHAHTSKVPDQAAEAVAFHNLDREQAQALEEKWTKLRKSWEEAGFEIMPSAWTFLRPVSWGEIKLNENEFSPVFRKNISRGIAFQIKAFGLRRCEGDVIRQCAVSVSAGPSPIGFDELQRLVEKPARPGEEELKHRLCGWPRACLLDAFDVAAERLFIDFWGSLGDDMRARDARGARQFAERLSSLLEQNLQLHTFYPEAYQEYPAGWLLVGSDHGGVTGKVRRIIRPGVKHEDGNLHVPAIVEID